MAAAPKQGHVLDSPETVPIGSALSSRRRSYKEPAAKAAALRWLGAVLAANGANADEGKSPHEVMRARQSCSSDGSIS